MKLNTKEYFDENGNVRITEQGWLDLRDFCQTVIWKRKKFNRNYYEDLVSTALLACVEKLSSYNPAKNDQLGGYLYFIVLGVISIEANKSRREQPHDLRKRRLILDE